MLMSSTFSAISLPLVTKGPHLALPCAALSRQRQLSSPFPLLKRLQTPHTAEQPYLAVLCETLQGVGLVHFRQELVEQLKANGHALGTRREKLLSVAEHRAEDVHASVDFKPAELCNARSQLAELSHDKGIEGLREEHLHHILAQLQPLLPGEAVGGLCHQPRECRCSDELGIVLLAVLQDIAAVRRQGEQEENRVGEQWLDGVWVEGRTVASRFSIIK